MHKVNTNLFWESLYHGETELWQSRKLFLFCLYFSQFFFKFLVTRYSGVWQFNKSTYFHPHCISIFKSNISKSPHPTNFFLQLLPSTKYRHKYVTTYIYSMRGSYTVLILYLPAKYLVIQKKPRGDKLEQLTLQTLTQSYSFLITCEWNGLSG